jgi:hypothetical protein
LVRHSPLFGEHTREILSSLVGLSDAEIDALYEAGVCAEEPVNPGVGETRANAPLPASMFSNDDLPTFERPANATSGGPSAGQPRPAVFSVAEVRNSASSYFAYGSVDETGRDREVNIGTTDFSERLISRFFLCGACEYEYSG